MNKNITVMLFLLLGTCGAQAFELKIGVLTGQLLFDVAEFDVEAGSEATITFHNNGFISHNLIFCDRGAIEKVFQKSMAMGEAGMQTGFVPPILEVLAAVPMLNPNDHKTITFTVPEKPGDYGYICTFPGHGNRMRGVMHVVPKGTPLREVVREQDVAKPALTDVSETSVTPFPEGSLARPMVVRTFMPDIGFNEELVLANHERGLPAKGYNPSAGKDTSSTVNPIRGLPAAMAVGFGETLSVCWDTVECRMLYAWTGGFLDMTRYWGKGSGGGRKKFGYVPELIGSLIYRANTAHPIRAGSVDNVVKPKYLGYRVVNHVPEFMYQIGDTFVQEQISPGSKPDRINMRYFVHGANKPVFFVVDDALKARMHTEAGKWSGTVIEITAATAKAGFELELEFSEPEVPPGGGSVRAGGPGIALPAFTSSGWVIESVERVRADGVVGKPVVLPAGMKPSVLVYPDRQYQLKSVPDALIGADFVQTYNNDKKGGKVNYRVRVKEPATLFVLVDTRSSPPWIKDADGKALTLKKTTLLVTTDFDFEFQVFALNLAGGESVLIGPQADASFYSLAARKGQLKELK